MTLLEMFANSVHLRELAESISRDDEVGDILMRSQMAVNSFIGQIGDVLTDENVADTFMMFGEAYSTDDVKYFAVGAIIHNKVTCKQVRLIFPFVLNLLDRPAIPAGLYFNVD